MEDKGRSVKTIIFIFGWLLVSDTTSLKYSCIETDQEINGSWKTEEYCLDMAEVMNIGHKRRMDNLEPTCKLNPLSVIPCGSDPGDICIHSPRGQTLIFNKDDQ